ncbi:MAG: transporter substrate-binding domain-containing protein [Methylococcales bacterium]|nr:transporter substrate-binding domain-containing protein [Methylococcales bacterium]
MHYFILLFFSLFLLNAASAGGLEDALPAMDKPEPAIQLTAKERAWLANHKKIVIAFDGALPPYSFLNDAGRLEGIAVEVMNTLGRRLGVQFETYPNTSWNKLYEAAAEHKVDVVATMVNRPDRSRWFIFTKPYLMKSLVIITRRDDDRIKNRTDLAGKTVTMIKGYQYVEQVIGEFPSVIPYFVDSMLDGLNAVNKEKVDAAIFFITPASYLQTKYQLTNLKVAAFYDRNSANESIAVRKDWPILATMLQKALNTISEKEMQAIYEQWVPSIKNPLPEHELKWEIGAAAFTLVLFLLLLWIVRIHRLKKKIAPSKTDDEATAKILQALQGDLEHLVLKRTTELNSSEQKSRDTKPNSSTNEALGRVKNPGNEYFFFQHNREGTFTYMSPSITNMLGYNADEFMAHYREYLTDNPVNLKIDKLAEQYVQGSPNQPYQLEIYDAQKNIHWLEVKDTPVYDEYGNCIGFDGIVHDITEIRQTENNLAKLSNSSENSTPEPDHKDNIAERRQADINVLKLADDDENLERQSYRNNDSAEPGQTEVDLIKFPDNDEGSEESDRGEKNAELSITPQICPRCGDENTRKSMIKKDDGILRILFFESYRCRECFYRFWVLNRLRLALFGAAILILSIILGGMPFFSDK